MLNLKLNNNTSIKLKYKIEKTTIHGIEVFTHSLLAGGRLLASTTLLADKHPTWALHAARALQRQIDANQLTSLNN
jgi:hypothetical protein